MYNPDRNGQFPPVIPQCAVQPCTVLETELIIVVDTSISMLNKRGMIQDNVDALIQFFRPFPNVRITLVGDSHSDCGEPSIDFGFDLSVRRFAQCVNSYNAIGRLAQTLTEMPFSPTARMEAVIISDGDGQGLGNRNLDFNATYQGKPIMVSSIVGFGGDNGMFLCGDFCSYEHVGYEYMELAARTGGGILEICNPNWSPLFIGLYNRMI